jgi:hypothetical protein
MTLANNFHSFGNLVICRSAKRRAFIQQALTQHQQFQVIKFASSVDDALKESNNEWYFIFIAPEFEDLEIKEFLTKIKNTQFGSCAITVMLLEASDSSSKQLPAPIQGLIDSVLVIPYSYESLEQLIENSQGLYEARKELLKRQNIENLLLQAFSLISLVVLGIKNDSNYENEIHHKLKLLAPYIHEYGTNDIEMYQEVLMELVDKELKDHKTYYGASLRLRKKAERKLVRSI